MHAVMPDSWRIDSSWGETHEATKEHKEHEEEKKKKKPISFALAYTLLLPPFFPPLSLAGSVWSGIRFDPAREACTYSMYVYIWANMGSGWEARGEGGKLSPLMASRLRCISQRRRLPCHSFCPPRQPPGPRLPWICGPIRKNFLRANFQCLLRISKRYYARLLEPDI